MPSHHKPGIFPSPIIIPPLSQPHSLTIIILHGRGFTAEKFHSPLLTSPISTTSPTSTFQSHLPHARIIFPSAPLSRSTKYRRSLIPQWYEGTGDWEPSSRGQMRPSVEHIHELLRSEIAKVGDARKVVLAGFSQGGAMALVSALLWEGDGLGGVVVMGGFCPLADVMMEILEDDEDDGVFERGDEERTALQRAIDELREEAELGPRPAPSSFPFLMTPVFMGHGEKDEDVECCHGRRAAELLQKMNISVDFHTYLDLDHWYSPEMLGDVVDFVRHKVDSS